MTELIGDGWALPARSHLGYNDRIRTVLFEAGTRRREAGKAAEAMAEIPSLRCGRSAQLLEIASGRKELQDVHWISSGGRKASDELR